MVPLYTLSQCVGHRMESGYRFNRLFRPQGFSPKSHFGVKSSTFICWPWAVGVYVLKCAMEAKSLTDQTTKLLGARVQTRSMELVLLPMALQVCRGGCALTVPCCSQQRGSHPHAVASSYICFIDFVPPRMMGTGVRANVDVSSGRAHSPAYPHHAGKNCV